MLNGGFNDEHRERRVPRHVRVPVAHANTIKLDLKHLTTHAGATCENSGHSNSSRRRARPPPPVTERHGVENMSSIYGVGIPINVTEQSVEHVGCADRIVRVIRPNVQADRDTAFVLTRICSTSSFRSGRECRCARFHVEQRETCLPAAFVQNESWTPANGMPIRRHSCAVISMCSVYPVDVVGRERGGLLANLGSEVAACHPQSPAHGVHDVASVVRVRVLNAREADWCLHSTW